MKYIKQVCDSNFKIISKKSHLKENFIKELIEIIDESLNNSSYNTHSHYKTLSYILILTLLIEYIKHTENNSTQLKISNFLQICFAKTWFDQQQKLEILFFLCDSLCFSYEKGNWIDNQISIFFVVQKINGMISYLKDTSGGNINRNINDDKVFSYKTCVLIKTLLDKSNYDIASADDLIVKIINIILSCFLFSKLKITQVRSSFPQVLREFEYNSIQVQANKEMKENQVNKESRESQFNVNKHKSFNNIKEKKYASIQKGVHDAKDLLLELKPILDTLLVFLIKFTSDILKGKILWRKIKSFLSSHIQNRHEIDAIEELIILYILSRLFILSEDIYKKLSVTYIKNLFKEGNIAINELPLVLFSIVNSIEDEKVEELNQINDKSKRMNMERDDYKNDIVNISTNKNNTIIIREYYTDDNMNNINQSLNNDLTLYSMAIMHNVNDLNDSLDYKNKFDLSMSGDNNENIFNKKSSFYNLNNNFNKESDNDKEKTRNDNGLMINSALEDCGFVLEMKEYLFFKA